MMAKLNMLNISENIFVMKGNIIDLTLGIIAYAISIQKKNRAHNLYPPKSVEDF